MDHDARQNQDHADDAQHVRRVLREQAVVGCVSTAAEHVDDSVHGSSDENDGEADAAAQRQRPELCQGPPRDFYR